MRKGKTFNFYKYFSINQNLYNSLINNELYFSNPRSFNDLFDSNPRFKLESERGKIKNLFSYLKDTVNQKSELIEGLDKFQSIHEKCTFILKTFIENLKNFDHYEIEEIDHEYRLIEMYCFYNYQNILENFLKIDPIRFQSRIVNDFTFLNIDFNNYGISCGSFTSTCPVMWGHYANNHQGICLRFEFDQNDLENSFPDSKEVLLKNSKVDYSDTPIDFFSETSFDQQRLINLFLNTKSEKWKYEEEIRLIARSQGPLKFRIKCIKEIIFGHRSTRKERYTICRIMANLGYKTQYSIAKISPDNYELNIEPMIMNDIVGSHMRFDEMNFTDS